MISDAKNVVKHYGKIIKIQALFSQKGWDGRALLGQPRTIYSEVCGSALKRIPVQDFNSFFIMFYYIISTTYKKIRDLFCPVIFLDFPIVWSMIYVLGYFLVGYWMVHSCEKNTLFSFGGKLKIGIFHITNVFFK